MRRLICRVGLSCKSNKTIFEKINLKRVIACDKDINPQIILALFEKMRFVDVLLYQVSTSFIDMSFLSNYFNSPSTAGCTWLHYVHVLVVLNLSLVAPSLVIFWEYISR